MDVRNVNTDDDRNLSAREAAKLLGICTRNLHNRKQSGEIPHLRIGKRVFYRKRELLEYLERQSQVSA